MFERFTDEARQVVVRAQDEARQLGHDYIGCEHLLLAASAAGAPAAEILRGQGVTPERIRAEIVRAIGPGAGPDPVRGLDRDALAAIGIDLDVVRARIEASFGPDALARAAQARNRAAQRHRRPAWGKGPVAELMRRRRRRRQAGRGPHPSQAHIHTPLFPGRAHGHVPFTPRAKKSLELSLRQALAMRDDHIGVEHVILALLTIGDGTPKTILAALGASGDSLRATILDRYRKAS
jgi:ATP-dependent Clp protease ATP-binding subunit ClpA